MTEEELDELVGRIGAWAWNNPLFFECRDAITALRAERDEADRAAGAALRQAESMKDGALARASWLRNAKMQRGYDDNVSFDVVWTETCAKADEADALRAEAAQLTTERLAAETAALERVKQEFLRQHDVYCLTKGRDPDNYQSPMSLSAAAIDEMDFGDPAGPSALEAVVQARVREAVEAEHEWRKDVAKVLKYYQAQNCESFCRDVPKGYTDIDMEIDCHGCKARAALAKIGGAEPTEYQRKVEQMKEDFPNGLGDA